MYTPGPWNYSEDAAGGLFNIFDADMGEIVRSGVEFGIGYGVNGEDNARLIAAAPELLAALINMLDDGDMTDREQARAVIAKATQG